MHVIKCIYSMLIQMNNNLFPKHGVNKQGKILRMGSNSEQSWEENTSSKMQNVI